MFGLVGQSVPKLDGKVDICSRKCCNERVFKSLNGPFRCVHMMIVWFHELEVTVVTCQECLDVLRGLDNFSYVTLDK